MLAQGGPDYEWLPAPVNKVQIACSADAQLQGLLRTGDAAGRVGLLDLAGIAAAWYFGNNPAEVPMYDPATGRTFDGIEQDAPPDEPQRVNVNSGAESTISRPAVDARARRPPGRRRRRPDRHPSRLRHLRIRRGRERRPERRCHGRRAAQPMDR
jgi:hypothetical protein